MDTEAALFEAELEKQLRLLHTATESASQGRALAILTVLVSRCSSDSQLAAAGGAVAHIAQLLASNDPLVQANACAALTAATSLDDQIASTVSAHTLQFIDLLLSSSSSNTSDVQLNVVSALGQLARDQEVTAHAIMQPQALSALLLLADAAQPANLQEAVADCLCALAAHEWTRQQLIEAGAVQSAAELLNVQQLEVSVRALMVLGMLLPRNTAAGQQLADNGAALRQLMELMKQGQDMDCKVIARDTLGVLMKDEGLRSKVEAAIREPAGKTPLAENADRQ
eukprot:GHUV01004991.1.p1 GENE.GHUV01004991.1~~GHUV01004991.1.p1  ORF type:complete len:283 (+),score=82.35 GHUV01004991.1:334-1182(+)